MSQPNEIPSTNNTKLNRAALAVVLAAAGLVCDFTGESVLSLVLVEQAQLTSPKLARSFADQQPGAQADSSHFAGRRFHIAERSATLLTAGVANALYTLGGILLTSSTPRLPIWVRSTMWVTWFAGAVMTVSAIAGISSGIAAATAILFPPLIVWVTWMALRGRPS